MSPTPAPTPEACTLVSSAADDLVQLMLGVMALASLLLKRHLERPQRPVHIWFLDASKQVLGALYQHGCNIITAVWFANSTKATSGGDQCAFYFVNFTIQTFVGVLCNYLLLRLFTDIAHKYNVQALVQSGFYGRPPFLWPWFQQLLVWVLILSIVYWGLAIIEYFWRADLGKVGDWLFKPMHGHPFAELVVVMLVCPCLMNIFQFWIQDSFLKHGLGGMKTGTRGDRVGGGGPEGRSGAQAQASQAHTAYGAETTGIEATRVGVSQNGAQQRASKQGHTHHYPAAAQAGSGSATRLPSPLEEPLLNSHGSESLLSEEEMRRFYETEVGCKAALELYHPCFLSVLLCAAGGDQANSHRRPE